MGHEKREFGETTTGRTELAYDAATPASIAAIQAICSIEDVDPTAAPTDLGLTLYDHVDPGALDTIVADGSGSGDLAVEFTCGEYHVRVVDTGRLVVEKRVADDP